MKLKKSTLKKIVIDTSSLMSYENIIEKTIDLYDIIISIVVVEELDNLRKNANPDVAFCARRAVRQLEKYQNGITFDLDTRTDNFLKNSETQYNTNDNIILYCAYKHGAYLATKDLNLKVKAKAVSVSVTEAYSPGLDYGGYKEVVLSEEELAEFYLNLQDNKFEILTNQYIVIKNSSYDVVDIRKWTENGFVTIYNKGVNTQFFGKIKAKDEYQEMAIDSIMSNTMTAISGPMGSAKTFLSLICAMKLIESGKYDKLVILFNPTKTRGAADMGYYPGSQIEKAMQNSIGQMLTSKFVDEETVLDLISSGKLELISMADVRGFEAGCSSILYLPECQNTSVDLMKLCLSRAAEGCKIIIEGDYKGQVDSKFFENDNNGLRTAINKLKGEDLFGYVDLKNIYRSKIASLVDSL